MIAIMKWKFLARIEKSLGLFLKFPQRYIICVVKEGIGTMVYTRRNSS